MLAAPGAAVSLSSSTAADASTGSNKVVKNIMNWSRRQRRACRYRSRSCLEKELR
jgi:hypothetical protein